MLPPLGSITSFDYNGSEITLPLPTVRHTEASFRRRLQEDAFGWPMPPRWMIDELNPAAGMPFRGATGTTNDRRAGRDLPLYWSEMDLRGFRVLSRWLCDTNDFAIGFLGLLADYNIRKGFGWQCCRRGAKKTPYQTVGAPEDKLVQRGQAILDAWRDAGPIPWPLRSYEAFQRWCRDGEVGIRFFKGGWNRLPEARFVSPEQIGSPDGNTDGSTSFGIETDPQDVETRWAFHIWEMDAGMTKGDWVDAAEIIFATKNTDSDVKRGLPDFFPVHESLDGVRTLLRTMLLTSIRQAAIAWREKYPTATQDQVNGVVPERATGAGYGVPANNAPGNWPYWMGDPRQYGFNRHDPGTVLKMEGTRQLEDGPNAGSVPNFVAAGQASLRGAGTRWRFPEYFSGDASNNNMASSIVAGGPFVVAVECTQDKWGALIERPTAMKVLDLAVGAGLLSSEERRQLDVEVTAPSVVTAKPVEETQTYTAQLTARIICLDTARQKLGYDPQHEAEGIKKDDATRPQVGPGVGPGGKTATGNPTPTTEGGGGLPTDTFRVKEHGGTHPPPGEGWIYDESIHHWHKAATGETHPGTPIHHPEAVQAATKWVAAATHLTSEIRQQYARTMSAALSRMPDACRKQAIAALSPEHGSAKSGVRFHADIATVTAECAKASGRKEKNVGGFVVHETNDYRGHFSQMHLDGTNGTGASDTAESIYLHELGHCVDVGRRYSDDPKWVSAYKREVTNTKGSSPQLSAYARESAAEGFAELHRVMNEKGIEETKARFPKMMAFLESKGLLGSGAMSEGISPADDRDEGTPLTPEELAERAKLPTWGREVFVRAIDQNGVLGDVLLGPPTLKEGAPGTNPPPGEGWLYDEVKHHYYKADTGETHPGTPATKKPVPKKKGDPTPKGGTPDLQSLIAAALASDNPEAKIAAALTGMSPEPKVKKKSKAKVHVNGVAAWASNLETIPVHAMLSRLFHGKSVEEALVELASVVGAPDDAKVSIVRVGKHDTLYTDDKVPRDGRGVRVHIEHPYFDEAVRFIGIRANGTKYIRNEIIRVSKDKKEVAKKEDTVITMFSQQVENAAENGFAAITTHAAGDSADADLPGAFNGYYTWLRFGYDQTIASMAKDRPDIYALLRVAYPKAKTILDVMATPKGRDWWKQNGADLYKAQFDLTEGSKSRAILTAYQQERESRKASA